MNPAGDTTQPTNSTKEGTAMDEKVCPDSYPDAPHYLRQDDAGEWYCPIEWGAEMEQERVASTLAEQAQS